MSERDNLKIGIAAIDIALKEFDRISYQKKADTKVIDRLIWSIDYLRNELRRLENHGNG